MIGSVDCSVIVNIKVICYDVSDNFRLAKENAYMVNYYLITAVLAVINLFVLIFIFEPKKTNYYFMI